jgi:hypothetical protein
MTTRAYTDFKENKSNKYLDFIKECREKAQSFSPEELSSCSTHHIVPRHHYKAHKLPWSTFNLEENLVKLTFEDHVKAHEIRFEVYGEFADKLAFTRMKNMAEDGMKSFQQAGGQAVNRIFREQGRMMYDPVWQQEQARKSMARPDALQIRSEAGKKGNRTRHQNVTVRKEDRYLWCYKNEPFLCTFGFDNGGDLLQELFKAKETPLLRVTPLVKGWKRSLHGWSCEKLN